MFFKKKNFVRKIINILSIKQIKIIIFERKLTTHNQVIDEEADLELINNNYDLELNNMTFEETDDKVAEDLC